MGSQKPARLEEIAAPLRSRPPGESALEIHLHNGGLFHPRPVGFLCCFFFPPPVGTSNPPISLFHITMPRTSGDTNPISDFHWGQFLAFFGGRFGLRKHAWKIPKRTLNAGNTWKWWSAIKCGYFPVIVAGMGQRYPKKARKTLQILGWILGGCVSCHTVIQNLGGHLTINLVHHGLAAGYLLNLPNNTTVV